MRRMHQMGVWKMERVTDGERIEQKRAHFSCCQCRKKGRESFVMFHGCSTMPKIKMTLMQCDLHFMCCPISPEGEIFTTNSFLLNGQKYTLLT